MPNPIWTRRIHEPFVAAALGIALTAGFGYAALLVTALALRIPLGAWWGAAVQVHGHAQLFGWMFLFVLGMGLYFLPRLRGARLVRAQHAPWGLALITVGIILRSFAQPALGFVDPSSGWDKLLLTLWAASAVLELVGFLIVAQMLIETEIGKGKLSREAPAYPVFPFLALALSSAALAFLSNLIGTLLAVVGRNATIAPGWDSIIIQLMLYGLAIPMAFVFSDRNLPLFLRLAMPPREAIRYLALAFAVGLALRVLPNVAVIIGLSIAWPDAVGAFGAIIQSIVILGFIWEIDLLRRRPPWTVNRRPNTRPDLEYMRKPTRRDYPDAGEYGRYELLLYSAYAWLTIAALLGIVRSFGLLLGGADLIPLDAERHALTIGFITLLIFGMAARMLPGFSGKRGVAFPNLVVLTFLLGNGAAFLRIVPLFMPTTTLSLALLGISGAVGWAAVAVLAFNLARTLRA